MSAFVVVSPSHLLNPWLPIAAVRAGEMGVLDLGYKPLADDHRNAIEELVRHTAGLDRWGIRWDLLADRARSPVVLKELLFDLECPTLILAGASGAGVMLAELRDQARSLAAKVFLEAYSAKDAEAAAEAGFDGVILKGHESSGRVADESAYLLLARARQRWSIPFWVQGGLGPDTAAAAFLADAAGIVLGEQLWLAAESPFDSAARQRWALADGSETVVIGDDAASFRFYSQTGNDVRAELARAIAQQNDWQAQLRDYLATREPAAAAELIPLGQEIAFARRLAEKHVNVAGILQAYRSRIDENLARAKRGRALEPAGPLAEAIGTRYPIFQAPLAGITDVPEFSQAVAAAGAVPCLAPGLANADQTRQLLEETRELVNGQAWGVGVVGYAPPELQAQQLKVIAEVKPRFVILGPGGAEVALQLENQGIHAFLHAAAPGALELLLRHGARRFVFAGSECGTCAGPRTSFTLWQQMIDVLLDSQIGKPEECQLLFAGGIHDGLTAAMAAALAAPLAALGMKIGVMVGTGYLFTHEAVECGAITEEFQGQAIACEGTVLLETGPGYATRCARTAFAEEFHRFKRDLTAQGKTNDELHTELELFKLARLRLASKGPSHVTQPHQGQGDVKLGSANEGGMYLLGQAAALRDEPLPLARLHEAISVDASALLERLATRRLPWQRGPEVHRRKSDDIAVVGMSCMFPKADDLRQYWRNIFQGIDAIEEVPADRWRADDYYSEDRFARDRVYSKWGGFLGKIKFDPMKWRIPPAALKSIEPIQLLALEVADRAMRDAGYDRRDFPRERAGVIFAAAGSHDQGAGYNFRTMMRHYLPLVEGLDEQEREKIFASLEEQLPEWTEDSFPGFLLNVIAGRIAREFNLNGPNYVVDAACAASLAALHAAIEQLRMNTSDMMLVGAADATNNPFCYMCFSKTHALSPRGRSRPFDDSADGISLGEGVAVIVLKRLADAERDGDRIYAVIKGIGSSSDGKNRSLTAPHPPGQAKAVIRAYDDAQFSPATVSLIEAHGTGTSVGDSAELATLSQVYNEYTERKQFVAVGSVKSMIGHTKTVAGLASLIKAILALKHGVLPPTLGVEKPTERIDFKASPFYLNTETRPWLDELGGEPRRAGVSAFGFGGTNFHVVLEEYQGIFHPDAELDLSPRPVELLAWQRATKAELQTALADLDERLAGLAVDDLPLLAQAVLNDEAVRVKNNECRLSIVAGSVAELRQKIARARELLARQSSVNDPTGIYYREGTPVSTREVCFLYPGQGSQNVNMLRDLVTTCRWSHPLFARANSLLADFLPEPITKYIYPPPVFCEEERKEQFRALSETRVAQPALGILELFATELLRRFGIVPGMVAGHSYGELVALHTAGCLTEKELLWLSAMRGKVCSEVSHSSPGGMAAVRADAKSTLAAIRELGLDLHLANMNAPDQTVIGGTESAIDAAVEQLTRRGLKISRLPVSAAFHTPLLAAGSDAMAIHFGMAAFKPPQIPVYSNTTGEAHGDNPVVIRELLTQHFSEPVQFEKEVRQIYADGARVFIEAGPGKVLSSLVGRILAGEPITALALDAPGRDGWTQLGHLLAQLSALGLPVTIAPWFQSRGLPRYNLADFFNWDLNESKAKPAMWVVGPSKAEPLVPLPARKRESGATALRAKFGKSTAGTTAPSLTTAPMPAAAPADSRPAMGLEQQPSATQNSGSSLVNAAPSAAPVVSRETVASQIATPASPGATTPAAPAGLSTSAAAFASTTSPLIRQRMTTNMNPTDGVPASGQPMTPHAGLEIFGQFQATTRHLLDLQQSQQRVLERFLETQERVLAQCLGAVAAAPIPAVAVAPPALPADIAPVAVPVVPPPAAVPPPAPRVAQPAPARPPVAVPNLAAPVTRRAAPAPSMPAAQAPVVAASLASQNGLETSHVAVEPRAASTEPAASAEGPPSTAEFRRDLLEIVSERTGYPVDMLDETLPLEAGLGIDSIKTVEIFSNLKKYHQYFADEDQDEEERLVEFTKLKTLKDIIDSYDRRRQALAGAAPPPNARPQAAVAGPTNGSPKSNGQVERYSLSAVEAPLEAGSEKKNSLRST